MTISLSPAPPVLPSEPPAAWTKPTLGNTKGGKLYAPTHPGLFRVEFTSDLGSGAEGEESFSSRLVAERAYSSVQFGKGPEDHLELNSDLLFSIASGGDITFFYPSTEWDMAQGFECGCGAGADPGIEPRSNGPGAKHLSLAQLEERGYVNQHIRELKAEQERTEQ